LVDIVELHIDAFRLQTFVGGSKNIVDFGGFIKVFAEGFTGFHRSNDGIYGGVG
jgi:hypothetical protein